MLEEFFNINKNSIDLFKDLEISKNKQICAEWMNKYPVINISLKQVNKLSYTKSLDNFSIIISNICLNNQFLIQSSKVDEDDRHLLQIFKQRKASEADLGQSLYVLCRALNFHFEKPVILLLDEYDVPLNYAWQYNYYQEMLDFIRDLFGFALKGNEYLKFAIITGCLRISKESIFTGVNNFTCFSISQSDYAETFGFTDAEVDRLLELAQLTHKKKEIKAWYDGYCFGENSSIYCPWDVVNYLRSLKNNPKIQPQNYWLNSSSNDIIKDFIKYCNFDVNDKLETLLNHGAIPCKIDDNLTYGNIYNSETNLWNLFYNTGYLTKLKNSELQDYNFQGFRKELLKIPNSEIESIFIDVVEDWFKQRIKSINNVELVKAFWNGDSQKFTSIISDILLKTISYYDYHENYYHAFLVGIFSALGYTVKSNLESGVGRSDILITDANINYKIGACIEVKRVEDSSESLQNKALDALAQIQKNKYYVSLSEKNLQIVKWGIAFYKKSCIAICQLS